MLMEFLEFKNLKNINSIKELLSYLMSISLEAATELIDFYLNLQIERYDHPYIESFLCSLKVECYLVPGCELIKEELIDYLVEDDPSDILHGTEFKENYSSAEFYSLLCLLNIRGEINIYFDGWDDIIMRIDKTGRDELSDVIEGMFSKYVKDSNEDGNRQKSLEQQKFKHNLLIWMLYKFEWKMAWTSFSEDSYQKIKLIRIRDEIEQDRKQIDDILKYIKESQKETHNDRMAIEDIKKAIDGSEKNIKKVKLELDNINKNIVTIMALLSTVFSIIGLNLYSMNASMTYVGIIILNVSLVFCLSFLFLLLDVLVYKSDDKRKIILLLAPIFSGLMLCLIVWIFAQNGYLEQPGKEISNEENMRIEISSSSK